MDSAGERSHARTCIRSRRQRPRCRHPGRSRHLRSLSATQHADNARSWLPSVSRGWLFPACQCAPVLAVVKQRALDGAAVRREREPPGATWRMDRRAGVGSQVAGPGSDFSEVPAQGCKPATLEPAAVPVCPPGPVAEARASLIICRQAWPGQPSLEAPDGFGAGLAGGELAAVAGAAFGVVAQLHDGHDVQHPVNAPVPGP